MINNITALQGLYVALGGNISDVKNISIIPEMLKKISEVAASAAAAELPKTTTADVNKVLRVNSSGKWGKGSAYFAFGCRVTHNTQDDTYTAEIIGAQFNELKTNALNGFVMLGLDNWGNGCWLTYAGGDNNTIRFSGIVYDTGNFYAVVVECTSSGTTIDVLKLSA